MDIIALPDYFVRGQKEPVTIYFYEREHGPDQIKLKLKYTQNMLCFMVKGIKEVMDENNRYTINDQQIGLLTSGSMLMTERVTLFHDFESLLLFSQMNFCQTFWRSMISESIRQMKNPSP